jgi:hypothetical protein
MWINDHGMDEELQKEKKRGGGKRGARMRTTRSGKQSAWIVQGRTKGKAKGHHYLVVKARWLVVRHRRPAGRSCRCAGGCACQSDHHSRYASGHARQQEHPSGLRGGRVSSGPAVSESDWILTKWWGLGASNGRNFWVDGAKISDKKLRLRLGWWHGLPSQPPSPALPRHRRRWSLGRLYFLLICDTLSPIPPCKPCPSKLSMALCCRLPRSLASESPQCWGATHVWRSPMVRSGACVAAWLVDDGSNSWIWLGCPDSSASGKLTMLSTDI